MTCILAMKSTCHFSFV